MPTPANEEKLLRFQALRAELAEKFPQPSLKEGGRRALGLTAWDGASGGLRRGAVTEICGPPGGGSLFLAGVLGAAVRDGFQAGLIDAGDSFEPADWPAEQLGRLLWVRCPTAEKAIQAADLLLRDGNLPILALDFQTLPEKALRRVPASTWHRFQRVIEPTALVLAVLTPRPMVESAVSRIAIRSHWGLAALDTPRPTLLANLETQIFECGAAAAPLDHPLQKSA